MKTILGPIFAVMVLLSAVLCPRASNARDAEAKAGTAHAPMSDSRALEGVWKPVSATLGGVKLPAPALSGITLSITGENFKVTAQGEHGADQGTSKLDASTTPKRMSTTSTSGPNKGKTFLAIYELQDANTIRVCYDLSGEAYPTEFNSTAGTQLYLVTYKRQ